MTNRSTITLMLLALLALDGCVTAAGPTWFTISEPRPVGDTAVRVLRPCYPGLRNPDVYKIISEVTCDAVLTEETTDEEFWTFTSHQMQHTPGLFLWPLVLLPPGIPTGRGTWLYRVVGPEAVCEWTRSSMAHGRPPNDMESGASGTPTTSCKGPFYFKRQTTAPATVK
jgi:hypothetical protein